MVGTSHLDFMKYLAKGLCICSHLLTGEAYLMIMGIKHWFIGIAEHHRSDFIDTVLKTSCVWFNPMSLGYLVSGSWLPISAGHGIPITE